MTIENWLRLATGLTIFLALGHTFGAVLAGPRHGSDEVAVRGAMRSMRFKVMGITRSYWDAYLGSGWAITILIVGSAAVMWGLVPIARENPLGVRPILIALTACYAGITAVGIRFFVTAPIVVSGLITIALATATFVAGSP